MLYFMKSLFCTIAIIITICSFTKAQQSATTYEGAQPDLPGMLLLDFGFNFLQNAPDTMALRTWGSRGFDIHYLYPFPIGESKFSVHTGLGFGFENYSFSKNITLNDTQDSTSIVPLDNAIYPSLQKTQLSTHYIDVPLEVRFFAKEDYRGFTVAVGGKAGRLINSFTKIRYEDDGIEEEDKFKRRYNLNPWRYGVHARVGFRGITLTGQYMFSELFTPDEGPRANNFKVGLTIGLF